MKIEVRPLRDTDIEELSRIEAASFSMPWSAEDFRGLLLRDYCLYVVAETDGHIAGCAGLTDSFHEGNIDNVVTAPEYRNLGVGSKMLEELLRLGAERGITAYTLEVRVSNAPPSGDLFAMIVKEETVFTIRKVEGKMRKSENGKLTQIICNACGRELKVEKEIIREGYFTADVRFGYFSRKDGMRHAFDLCEDCYDSWIGRFVIPVEEVPETELL